MRHRAQGNRRRHGLRACAGPSSGPGLRRRRRGQGFVYLDEHGDLSQLLPEICGQIRKQFGPEAELSLELYRDPEINDRYLTLYLRQEIPLNYPHTARLAMQVIRQILDAGLHGGQVVSVNVLASWTDREHQRTYQNVAQLVMRYRVRQEWREWTFDRQVHLIPAAGGWRTLCYPARSKAISSMGSR